MHTPKPATDQSSTCPVRSQSRRRATNTLMITAPIAGDARSTPSPVGPTCRISAAKIGSSATAPPKNTEKRSSVSAPKSTGSPNTNVTPPFTDA